MLSNRLSVPEIDLKQILYKIRMLAVKIHQLSELSEILQIIVNEARKTLNSDRAIIYRFLPDGDGVIAEESVGLAWKPILGQLIYDPCFDAKWVEQYQQGRIGVIEDINTKPLDPCYKNLLTSLQIRANLVVPILVNQQKIDRVSSSEPHLWGLLIVHQCSSARKWSSLEIEYLQLLATELGIALGQVQQFQSLKKQLLEPKLKLKSIKKTLHRNSEECIITETALPKNISVADLMAFERLQTPIWIYDIEKFQMWWANSAALYLWNAQSREELLNRNFSDVSESTRIRLHNYLQIFQQGETIAENWTFYPEGKPVSVRCLCSGIQIKNGEMAVLVEGTTEVTNQIGRETLRSLEALHYTTLMISLYTLDGIPLMQNPATFTCYGDIMHPSSLSENVFLSHFVDSDVGEQAIEAIILGKTFTTETQVFTKQGIRWHGMDIRCSRDPVTGDAMILVNEKDITERKHIEEALRESEERYRSVIKAMAEGIVLHQADGSIIACNESAEKILGLTVDQMMGRAAIDPRWQTVHEDGTSFLGESHPAIVTLRTGQPRFNEIMGVHKPNNRLSWISINSQPLFKPNESKPYAVVASFTDITVRKQAEIALQQQTERERMVFAIAQHIRQSLDLDEILNTTVAEVRHFLQTDRVVIYRFNPDWSGVAIAESVAEGWQPILNMQITDPYFVQTQGLSYQQGTVATTRDIYTAGFSPCHVELLEKLQVRAKVVVPILQGDRLWGLLIAHHCSAPRQWQYWESKLLQQLATQIAIAIQQSELYQKLQLANQQLENIAMVDQLTQIANRRHFDSALDCTWRYLLREQGSLSLLICDIDYFKQYNDTYGHAAGDDCLRLVAQAFKQTVKRSTDLAARYGGEEFVVILPNTYSDGAFQVAEEIHQAIQQLNIPHIASAV
ncbi:GAF domain-containing protein, partial [Nostoc sp. NMS4]|uniref:GAF domain-containing protein n=1 Tax=Nostoc sp. NMS4 TaxID=2815390 RepID=UPI0025FE8D01